jgi:hypothetical protein
LRIECVSRDGFILFNISDAEEREELAVVRFDAVGFKNGVVRVLVSVFIGR